MIFTEARFFVFFGIAFFVYWALKPNAARKIWLLGCSIVFYAAWDWRFLGLVLVTIVQTYIATLLLAGTDRSGPRRAILATSASLALLTLGYFKYYNFFIDSLSAIIPLGAFAKSIILPVGISFYTFHALSYLIDTYRRKIDPTKNIIDVSLYVLFFPQLVAGPIVRATDLLLQMQHARSFEVASARYFIGIFLIGYFKKAVISDGLAPLVDVFFANPGGFGAGDMLTAVFFYTVQIYCDFSGYTDMAIAIAGLLGYRLKPNFNHPYLASNLIEFWRRWHISLSSWLRDYVYVSLGGNRGGYFFQIRNIVITMLLGGLWHGASWTFVVWGAVHAFGLAVCHTVLYFRSEPRRQITKYSLAGNMLTFLFVSAAWVLFRSPDFATAMAIFGRLAIPGLPTLMAWWLLVPFVAFLTFAHVTAYRYDLAAMLAKQNNETFALSVGAAVAIIIPLISLDVVPFIYFQF
jgi:alginate O-acetyltransferase complex protein AlgI